MRQFSVLVMCCAICSYYITAAMPVAQNTPYRYAMYKDKRHASDSITKTQYSASKGSGLTGCRVFLPAVCVYLINNHFYIEIWAFLYELVCELCYTYFYKR